MKELTKKLDKDPTPKYKRKIVGMLQNLKKENKITDGQYKYTQIGQLTKSSKIE